MTTDRRTGLANERTRTANGGRRSGQTRRAQARTLILPETLTVQRLSELIDQSPIDVIKQLMRNGIMAAMNQVIDYKMATLVTTAFGIRTTMAEPELPVSVSRGMDQLGKTMATWSPAPPS